MATVMLQNDTIPLTVAI